MITPSVPILAKTPPSPPPAPPISCLQINLRHSKLASAALSQLMLDMNVDVACIQEPYATRDPISNSILLENIPLNYDAFHALSDEHAYGTAIVVKRSARAFLHPISSNELSAICLNHNGSTLTLLSIYARPTAPSISSVVAAPLDSLSKDLSTCVICMDSNAKNRLWNSPHTDSKGQELEDVMLSNDLYLVNNPTCELDFTPPSTNFVDVTIGGKQLVFTSWHFLPTF